MFGSKFSGSSCKTKLKMVTARIKLLRNKREVQLKQMRREIATLLKNGQEPSARIRVEHIIREQNIMDAYDLLELFCELIVVRLPVIESQRECPPDLKEAISSIIFAAPRAADLPELLEANKLFTAKFGKEFVAAASELRPECGVNRKIIEKLSVRAPSGQVKLDLLIEIAEQEGVDWDPMLARKELTPEAGYEPDDLLEPGSSFMPAIPTGRFEAGPSSIVPPQQPPAPVVTPAPAAPTPPHPVAARPPPVATSPPAQVGRNPGPAQHAGMDTVSPKSQAGEASPMFVPFFAKHNHSRMGSLGQRAPSNDYESRDSEDTKATSEDYEEEPQMQMPAPPGRGQAAWQQPTPSSSDYEELQRAARTAATAAEQAAVAARAAARLAEGYTRQPGLHADRDDDVGDDMDKRGSAFSKPLEPDFPFNDQQGSSERVGGSGGTAGSKGGAPGYHYAQPTPFGAQANDENDVAYSVFGDSGEKDGRPSGGAGFGLRPDTLGSAEKYPFDSDDSVSQGKHRLGQKQPQPRSGSGGGGQPDSDDGSYRVIDEAPPSGLVRNNMGQSSSTPFPPPPTYEFGGNAAYGSSRQDPFNEPGQQPPGQYHLGAGAGAGAGFSSPFNSDGGSQRGPPGQAPTSSSANEDLDDDMMQRLERLRPGRM